MRAKDIMTEGVVCCTPEDSIERAAHLMEDNDCGCIPVVETRDRNVVVGVITDRDVAVRAVGHGMQPDTQVRDVMTAGPCCCSPDARIQEVESIMADRQIRRVMVVDDAGCCVGVIAQADLARAATRTGEVDDAEVGRVVEKISEPTRRGWSHPISG